LHDKGAGFKREAIHANDVDDFLLGVFELLLRAVYPFALNKF
jgi:hypothetical protein